MSTISSGCYIIDSDYNIVSVNETAKAIYPQLTTGDKCYHSLLGLDAPCPQCPVANGIKGPNIYKDPIRNIAETVDAVEVELSAGKKGYALIFSTVGEAEELAGNLPLGANELKDLAIVKALTIDYSDLFSVELATGDITFYRHNGDTVLNDSIIRHLMKYDEEKKKYVDRFIPKEDREEMLHKFGLPYIIERLRTRESITIHYRVVYKGEMHYFYRRVTRAGAADSFAYIIVGIACEDAAMESHRKMQRLERNLTEVEIDSKAGLYTKEAFLIHGQELLDRYPDEDFDFCLLKLENLGVINHRYSRTAGDNLIRLVGGLLKEYDDDHTCLAYFGDGIFASFTQSYDAEKRRNRVLDFRDTIVRRSQIKDIVAKWALYVAPKKDMSVDEIIEKTNFALSMIRTNVHEDYIVFDQKIMDRMDWERKTENEFDVALKNREIVPWYQPKYSLKTGKIIGAEALARWIKPDGSQISPADFVPILENSVKVDRLDVYIFKEVCRLQEKLQDMGFARFPISVNLSRASMFTESLVDIYSRTAATYGVSPENMPIEITESAAVRAADIQGFANNLLRRGFVLHMDDFGSGFSSLASLQFISFESIKLDKTLIDLIGHESNENLLKHTIAYAKESGKSVIAEGVETYEQYMFLKFVGCDAVQGYYFSKPVDEATFIEMLKKERM